MIALSILFLLLALITLILALCADVSDHESIAHTAVVTATITVLVGVILSAAVLVEKLGGA